MNMVYNKLYNVLFIYLLLLFWPVSFMFDMHHIQFIHVFFPVKTV